jgi:hypothetical protein
MDVKIAFNLALRSVRAYHSIKKVHRLLSLRIATLQILHVCMIQRIFTEEEFKKLESIPGQIWTAAKTAVRASKALDETIVLWRKIKTLK